MTVLAMRAERLRDLVRRVEARPPLPPELATALSGETFNRLVVNDVDRLPLAARLGVRRGQQALRKTSGPRAPRARRRSEAIRPTSRASEAPATCRTRQESSSERSPAAPWQAKCSSS